MNAYQQGTRAPYETDSRLCPVFAVGLGDVPRQRDKAAPTGEVTFSTGTVLRVESRDGTVRNDKTASVNVLEPAPVYELGTLYRSEGRVYLQPYESNGRVALSVTCQRLVPVTVATAA